MTTVEDLGIPEPPVDEEIPPDEFADEEIDETYLSEEDKDFVKEMVARTVMFCEELADMELRPYQREMAGRIVESVILADGEEITGCWCRQSGKSQTLAIVVAGMLVLFPKLALTFDMFERFKRGMWVGMYAPVDNQSEFIFTKVMDILKSQHAKVFLTDPEIDEKITAGSKLATLKSGSYVRRQTANPKAKIEGASYHLVIVDEAQDVDDLVVRKSIAPMLASVAGSMVKIGTPSFHKGDFHRAIQLNKRRATKRGGKRFHFEYDYKVVSKYNPYYAKFIKREKIRIGEESDEFLMSYALKWQLDRGMLVTEDELDYLADPSMVVQKSWFRSPVVVGIDPARVQDSTVVTVCWVDWDHPDPAGYREHRILNWLEIQNTDYEEQYFEICEFLEHYDVAYVGVDAQGMGGPMADRLKRLLGHRSEVVALTSDLKNQSERWQHLIQLIQRRMIVYPGHSKARRLRSWKRFRQQMEDAEKLMRGQYLLIQAPDDTRDSHDDYVDSLALAVMMSQHDTVPEAEISSAPWFR